MVVSAKDGGAAARLEMRFMHDVHKDLRFPPPPSPRLI